MSNRRLALDGPSNGQYITSEEADEQGYGLTTWPSLDTGRHVGGEQIYVHHLGEETLDFENYDPDPVYTTILEAVNDAEVR